MAEYDRWGTAEEPILMSPLQWERLAPGVRELVQHVHLYVGVTKPPVCVDNRFGGLCA